MINFTKILEDDIKVVHVADNEKYKCYTLQVSDDINAFILDSTVGCENWQVEYYAVGSVSYCKIGININYGEPNKVPLWVYKSGRDFRSAASIWGVCRGLENINVKINANTSGPFKVDEIRYDENEVSFVSVSDSNNKNVFKSGIEDDFYYSNESESKKEEIKDEPLPFPEVPDKPNDTEKYRAEIGEIITSSYGKRRKRVG